MKKKQRIFCSFWIKPAQLFACLAKNGKITVWGNLKRVGHYISRNAFVRRHQTMSLPHQHSEPAGHFGLRGVFQLQLWVGSGAIRREAEDGPTHRLRVFKGF